jgi:hypothetical protein
MKVLAIIDLVILIEYLLMIAFPSLPFHIRLIIGDAFCIQLFTIVRATLIMSSWTLVYIATTRLIAVAFPLRSATWLTFRKARIFFALNGGIFFLWSSQNIIWRRFVSDPTNPRVCYITKYYLILAAEVEIVQTVFYVYGPWVFLLFLNVATLTVLHRRNRDVIGQSLSGRKRASDKKDEDAITRMLLMTTFLFLIIYLPRCAYSMVWDVTYHSRILTSAEIEIRRIHYKIANIMSNVNHAANFYMYLIPCRKFRKNLIEIFKCSFQSRAKIIEVQSSKVSK